MISICISLVTNNVEYFFIGHFYVSFDEISFLLFFLIGMFVLFHTVHGVLKARILKWFAIPFSSGPKLWKILKELGIPDHLICLLRNLYAGQQATELDKSIISGSRNKI